MLVKLIEEAYLREAAEEQGFTDKIKAGLGKIKNGVSNAFDKATIGIADTPLAGLGLIGSLTGAGLGAYLGADSIDDIDGMIGGSDIYAPNAAAGALFGGALGAVGANAIRHAALNRAYKRNLFK